MNSESAERTQGSACAIHAARNTVLPEPASAPAPEEEEEHYPKYANIPPKPVREKREREMRKAYDELLAIGREERKERRGLFGRRKKSNRTSLFPKSML